MISPLDAGALEDALDEEAKRAERESLGWLAASETSFGFWDNEEDEVWDTVTKE